MSLTIATLGDPTPDVMWMKDGKPLAKMANIMMTEGKGLHTLTLKNTSLSDAGTYGVIASNHLGESICEARLDVHGNFFIQ